jgi:hypothetical protein
MRFEMALGVRKLSLPILYRVQTGLTREPGRDSGASHTLPLQLQVAAAL